MLEAGIASSIQQLSQTCCCERVVACVCHCVKSDGKDLDKNIMMGKNSILLPLFARVPSTTLHGVCQLASTFRREEQSSIHRWGGERTALKSQNVKHTYCYIIRKSWCHEAGFFFSFLYHIILYICFIPLGKNSQNDDKQNVFFKFNPSTGTIKILEHYSLPCTLKVCNIAFFFINSLSLPSRFL